MLVEIMEIYIITRHHNRRGAEIHLAISTLLAGSRKAEIFIEPYVWIPRRHCSCGAPSDWIAWIIHLLATR